MRSTSVRRGNGGSRASRVRRGALGAQCSSRCLDSLETLAGLFTVASFGGSALDASDGISEADPPRLTRLDEPSSRTVPTSDVPVSSKSHRASAPRRNEARLDVDPPRVHPVKDVPVDESERLRSCPDTHAFTYAVCARRGSFGSASRHGAPVRSPSSLRVRQQRARRDSCELGLATVFRCAATIHPADFCHLFHLNDLHSRARFSAS